MDTLNIRLIEPRDNQAVKGLVLATLAEFGLFGEGFAGVDAELDDMFSSYDNELSAYYVVEKGCEILGAAGYAPLIGVEPGTVAELRKMYLSPTLRGFGIGKKLIEICIQAAKANKYRSMYLETVDEMQAAINLYQRNGFVFLENRLGDTGHSNCGVTMQKVFND